MSALAVTGAIVGYLLIGVVAGRISHRFDRLSDEGDVAFLLIAWPIALVVVAIGAPLYGAYLLATRPTKRERLEQQRRRAQRRIAELEQELGL